MSGRAVAAGLVVLAVTATALEGGGSPDGILVVHALLTALLAAVVLAPPTRVQGLPPPALAALAAFATAALASAWHAPYGFAAWLVMQDVAVGVAVLWLAAGTPGVAATPARLVLLATAACQGGMALGQALAGGERAAGSFLNPNHLAAWCTAALLAAVPPLLAQGARLRAAALALSVGALAALAVSRSRGAAAGAIAGVALLVLLRWPALPVRARRAALAGALAALLLAGALFADRMREDDPYRWTRTKIWSASLAIARSSPLLGCGPGQFVTAATRVRFQDPVGPLRWERRFSTPHSDVLRLPAELGLPAALAVALFLAVGLPAAVRRARRDDGLGPAATLAALAALAVQGTVDDLTTRPALVVLGALLLGPLWAVPRAPAGRRWPALARTAMATVLAVVFAAGDVAPWLAWRTLTGVPRAAVARVDLTRALAWNPAHPDMYARLAEWRLRQGLRSPDDYAAARLEAEAAARLSPDEARYRLALARVEAAACRTLFPDEATRARAAAHYAAAAERAPRDASIPLEEADFLLATGDPAGGERAARRAWALEPEAVLPRLVLARALIARGEPAARHAAAALVREAESLARTYASLPKLSSYARLLLTADPRLVAALRKALP